MAQVAFGLGRQDGSITKIQLLPILCCGIRADAEFHRSDVGGKCLCQRVPQHSVRQTGGADLAQGRDQAGFYRSGQGFFGNNNDACLVHR